MAHVRLNTAIINDAASFHAECQRALGFLDFYGANMNAWNDCMSSLRSDDGMIGIRLGPEERLDLEIPDIEALQLRAPEVVTDLIACTAFVNKYKFHGEPVAIALLFT